MLKTNSDKCVMMSIQGKVNHPKMTSSAARVGFDGLGRIVPAVAGITYNYFIGDCCMGIMGDHVEPGVSSKNPDVAENAAYNFLASVGNEVTVISGDAKGDKGVVSGTHGGIEHVIIAFSEDTLHKLTMEDKFLIKSFGLGLKLIDYPEIEVMNIDPNLLEKMNIEENGDGTLTVPVTHIVPAYLMGSGLGSTTMKSGDYDIMTHDPEAVKEFNLETLRFGDIVMIEDHTCVVGADYLKGSRTIGVVVHSDSFSTGHGPGVCVLMSSSKTLLKPKIVEDANIANYLNFKK